jgi:thiosulfate/3-mercaptopyruvate sulfurtransferase
MIALRAGVQELTPGLEAMFEHKCAVCHATCSQCHISRPHSVDKGLVRGHVFLGRPSMTENCTACHGSRIGQEFRGEHPGIPADVHYNKGMQCVACHSAQELHGHGEQGANRYQVASAPQCQDCHQVGRENPYHAAHAGQLACQVCHSTTYKNCYSCHVGQGLERPSELGFKIGLNPIRSAERPYEYAVVRHIPIAPDSYRDYEPGGLPNFSALPTWKFATPHNIQKNAPQAANCTSSCHNNAEVFLTEADLEGLPPEEVEANQKVIIRQIPH